MDEHTTPEEPDYQPPLRKETVAFYGYTPFPPLMALYTDYSGLTAPLRTLRLCGGGGGTSKADQLLYIVDIHYGYTPRGPLQFRPGLYLRNGATAKAPILAAAGDDARRPVLVSTFSLESVIQLPPVDLEAKNPTRDLVTEVLRASTTSITCSGIESCSSTRLVTFRFAIEVGVKMREREDFEWVDASGLGRSKKAPPAAAAQDSGGSSSSASAAAAVGTDTTTKGTRFVLLRCPGSLRTATSSRRSESAPSSSSSMAADDLPNDQGQILAELVLTTAWSWNRLFSLELKGAGRTGELGDRWALMVVMTALRIYWLRSYGKTGKGVVRVGEKVRGI
ncbi:hypothetical protein B0H66DRAFT_605187 [Apodospora peruviana]|uniref:Uncharacterized protein n=1 Tax=Apodospora peruviana TaxID=516989 RepID=A0AAE0I288_9PEZI|nr:hypothetical protein B0H66DRAFT_605187 [Apodospora peruviana]